MNRLLLLATPETEAMATEIKRKASYLVDVEVLAWDRRFPDGFPDQRIQTALRGRDVCFLASFHSPDAIERQTGIIWAIPRFGARTLRVVAPFFPGTMERVRRPGEIATAKTYARQLSATPACRIGGMAEFVFYDIHQTGIQFYFDDTVLVRLETAIPLLKNRLRELGFDRDETVVLFTDDGGQKRFGDDFPEFEKAFCAKVRGTGDERIVKLVSGELRGRKVVVVDDLIERGGTLIGAGRVAREEGARDVIGFATHFVGPGESETLFIPDFPFSRVIVTDSHPSATRLVDRAPFEILSLRSAIAAIIREE
ncbi:MAG: phosphoribosyltransferase family protein [Candidatus Uhrbacteria bacterium]